MENPSGGPLTAKEFFERDLPGVTLTAAQNKTGLAYTTVLRARDKGATCDPATLRALEEWSRSVQSAVDAGVWIDAAKTLGFASPPPPASVPTASDFTVDSDAPRAA